ncbi:hypothetical protein V9657_001924 [Vibrio vulnificus]|nr:hypothetical protein [Vibrio vulnificus]
MIYFLHPKKNGNIGGIETIIYEIVKHASLSDNSIGLLDYENSPLVARLKKDDINFKLIIIEEDLTSTVGSSLKETDVLVVFNNSVKIIPLRVSINVKVIVWDVYYPYWKKNYLSIFNHNSANKLFEAMVSKHGIISMDEDFKEQVKYEYGQDIPIVPPPVKALDYNNGCNFSPRKICYIGRNEHWKNIPLANFIIDSVRYIKDFEIDIYTDDHVAIENELQKIIGPSIMNVKIRYFGGLYGHDLHERINGYDFGVAMGMSALLLSTLKVPTLILDSASDILSLEGYKYRWLGQSKRLYDVGMAFDNSMGCFLGGEQLGVKMTELESDRNCIITLNSELLERFKVERLLVTLTLTSSTTQLRVKDFNLLYSGFIGVGNKLLIRLKRRFFCKIYNW